jgi:hypothetical protein
MPKSSHDSAHDVLAAEEFAMPSGDPALEPPHDVLAADEFAVPTADPELHHGPVVLPGDPSGIEEAHDVLAAEAWAMPATHPHPEAPSRSRSSSLWRPVLTFAAGVAVARLLRRR